jgi:hypothetical protein
VFVFGEFGRVGGFDFQLLDRIEAVSGELRGQFTSSYQV